MADNYLEKRMEELRSGRLAVKSRIPGIRPGSPRIIAVGGTAGKARDEVLLFRRKGYRVAVFDPDKEAGQKMAYENGIRYHHIDKADPESLKRETENLLKIWRDIDLIVGDETSCRMIGRWVAEWRNSLPIPDLSEVKFVII